MLRSILHSMFSTNYLCDTCGKICPAHVSHPLEILDSNEWRYQLQIDDKPTYFIEDKMFCSAVCVEIEYQKMLVT